MTTFPVSVDFASIFIKNKLIKKEVRGRDYRRGMAVSRFLFLSLVNLSFLCPEANFLGFVVLLTGVFLIQNFICWQTTQWASSHYLLASAMLQNKSVKTFY